MRHAWVLNSAICGLESVICQGIPLASWRPDNRPFRSHLKTVCVEIGEPQRLFERNMFRQAIAKDYVCSVDLHGW